MNSVDLLRLSTAGSVDDGKSTLVGRLLYETKSIFDDQLMAIEAASRRLGEDAVNLALLTDGLRDEREQKITIDVAYRYFATPRRKFIIADTPGHVQYTRNMVTGASTTDVAIVLIDASTGAHTQSRRHAFIASLLGIPHLIVAVNKMDLVHYDEAVYQAIVGAFSDFTSRLTVTDVTYIPVSSLHGDNVVAASPRMPWYQGGPLLHRLETVQVSPRNSIDFRFPVQCVLRPNPSFRGYAGTVASGSVRAGDEVLVLPSRIATSIRSIETYDGGRDGAVAGDAVVITTTSDVDISRGDVLARPANLPTVASTVDAYLCWTGPEPLEPGFPYLLQQTTKRVKATVIAVTYRIDVDTLHRDVMAATLGTNDIGRVAITAANPLVFDPHRTNPATGCFILIDPRTNLTVAAGMIRGISQAVPAPVGSSPNVVRLAPMVGREAREDRNGHLAGVVWLTGLPGSGKSTVGRATEQQLFTSGHQVVLIDGDDVRHGLSGDLGFSAADRTENIRRAGEVARMFFEQGSIVICAFVSPYGQDRARVRALFPTDRFVEVFVKATVETCRRRDPKGHYRRAATGEVAHFTGVSAPYEAPSAPDLLIETEHETIGQSVERLTTHLRELGWLRPASR